MLNPSLLSAAHTAEPESLIDFLAKPVLLLTGVLASTDTNATFYRPTFPLQLTTLEPFTSKLKGFLGMRADIVIRLVVNANKFQQGRYILGFIPFGGTGYTSAVAATSGTRFANLTTITQLPHVEIDLSTQTSCVLEIPFVNVYSHFPVAPPDYPRTHNGGQIFLVPYSPLSSTAGTLTANFDVFASFKNVDLAAPVYPQSSGFKAKSGSLSSNEQKQKKIGPVAPIMFSIGELVNTIGDHIPTLSYITKPVSWAVNLMTQAACAMGWSNPLNLEHARRVNQTAYPYAANCDNVDSSMPLSLFSANEIEVLPGFAGNDIDEMSIDYIKAKPAYIKTITWSDTDATDALLYDVDVSPRNMYTSFASGTNTVRCYSPVGYLSNFFNLYRGGIRFTFKIVKTEFHSGRLSLIFNPNAAATTVAPVNNFNSSYCHREILDIRDGLVFDFIVPYVSLTPYKFCSGDYSAIGNLSLRVLNPLVRPATVSSSVKILMEVSGAPDLEFSVPANHDMQITSVYNAQASTFVPKKDESSIATGIIGNANLIHDDHFSARACIGEKVTSLLSYLKKSDVFPTSFLSYKYYIIDPFAMPIWTTTAGNVSKSDIINDNLTLISSMYLFNRGGVRLRQFDYGTTITSITTAALIPKKASGTYSGYSASSSAGSYPHALVAYNSTVDGSRSEIQIPQYHRFHSRIFTDSMYGLIKNVDYSVPTTSCVQVEFGNGAAASSCDIGRQVADDFQCGFFLGVMPILHTTTAL